MITTVWSIAWRTLLRDRPALVLTFVVPVLFFTLFALVFGAMDGGGGQPVAAVVAVPADDARAERFAALVAADPALDAIVERGPGAAGRARSAVAAGEAAVAIVLPRGFGEALEGALTTRPRLELLVDRANPLAAGVARGAVQVAALRTLSRQLAAGGVALPAALPGASGPATASEASGAEAATGLVEVAQADPAGRTGRRPSIAYFAAGIGVMFLLFAVSGRAAILIEERESGVLARMLASRVTLGRFLAGRWLFLASLGFLQVSVMFLWGALAFGLELFTPQRLVGFVLMTAASAAAAAALGLLLSAACRTRAQLAGVSIALVLAMSAVGGSMFPRFLMPESLRAAGLATFNAWALDGYQKVFWYDAGLRDLAPQLGVLTLATALFLAAAVAVARRWRATL